MSELPKANFSASQIVKGEKDKGQTKGEDKGKTPGTKANPEGNFVSFLRGHRAKRSGRGGQ